MTQPSGTGTGTGQPAEGTSQPPNNQGPDAGNQPPNQQQPPANQPSNEPPEPEDELAKAKRHARWWESQFNNKKKEHETATGELENLKKGQQSEAEKAIEKAREEGKNEAEKAWRTKFDAERRTTAARTALSGVATNPDLLLPHLPLNDIEVADDGTVDPGALSAAIDKLMDSYPDQKKADSTSSNGNKRGMDMGAGRRAPTGSGKGSLESGKDLYEQRHGSKTT